MFEIDDVLNEYHFVKRLNKYTGIIKKGKSSEKVYVPNPGRLKNLLVPNAPVFVKKTDKPNRKTQFDLLAVKNKEDIIVGIDSRLPNWLFEFLLKNNEIEELKNYSIKKKEYRIGNSRIDYLLENKKKKYLVELKICTLVEKSTLLFPDAVSARSTKHLLDLIKINKQEYQIIVYFLGLRSDPTNFRPNSEVDPKFSDAFNSALKESIDLIPVKSDIEYKNNKLLFSNFEKIPIA